MHSDFEVLSSHTSGKFIVARMKTLTADDRAADECISVLRECQRAEVFDHAKFKHGSSLLSLCSQSEKLLRSVLEHEVVDILAALFDQLLIELKEPPYPSSMLHLCNAIEDLAEHQQGKEACGSLFVSRLVTLVTSKFRDIALHRAASESLCALVILTPTNQQLLANMEDGCKKMFSGLLPTAADYTIQATIMEVLFRLARRFPDVLTKFCKSKSLQSEMQILLQKTKPDMAKEMRHLVNRLNDSLGARKSIHTFAVQKLKANNLDVTCSTEKWMDISNHSSAANNHISFYILEDKGQEEGAMHLVDIFFPNIVQIKRASSTGVQLQFEDRVASHAENSEDPPIRSYHIEFQSKDMPSVEKYFLKRVQECLKKKKNTGHTHQKVSIGIMPGQATPKTVKLQKLATVFAFNEKADFVRKGEAKSQKTEDPIESFSTQTPGEVRLESVPRNKRPAGPVETSTRKVKRATHETAQKEMVPPDAGISSHRSRRLSAAKAARDATMQQEPQIDGKGRQASLKESSGDGKIFSFPEAVKKDLMKDISHEPGASKVPHIIKQGVQQVEVVQVTHVTSACMENGVPRAAFSNEEDRSCEKKTAVLIQSRETHSRVEKVVGGQKLDRVSSPSLKNGRTSEVPFARKERDIAVATKDRVSTRESSRAGKARRRPTVTESPENVKDNPSRSRLVRMESKEESRSESSLQRIRDILGGGEDATTDILRKRNDVETPKAPSPLDSKRTKFQGESGSGFRRVKPPAFNDFQAAFASPPQFDANEELGELMPTPVAASPLDQLSPEALSVPVTPAAPSSPEKKRRRRFPCSQKQTQTVLDFQPPEPDLNVESSPEDTKTIMRLAQTFKRLKSKMKAQSLQRRQAIQQGAVEYIQKKLQDAEEKIAQDLSNTSSVLQKSSVQLQGKLEAHSKKIKSAYEVFCGDLKQELEQYDSLYSQLVAVQGKLKTLHEEQRTAHKELLAEAAQACESMIVESGKKLKVADKESKLWQQTRQLLDQTFQDVTTEWMQ